MLQKNHKFQSGYNVTASDIFTFSHLRHDPHRLQNSIFSAFSVLSVASRVSTKINIAKHQQLKRFAQNLFLGIMAKRC